MHLAKRSGGPSPIPTWSRAGGAAKATFEAVEGKTKVTSVGHMGSVEALEGALSTGMIAGALETWDRLAALLTEL
jgi:hypothetical protein